VEKIVMRLARVSSDTQLSTILGNAKGQFILTNVTFHNSPAETIRLNVTLRGWTYWRERTGRQVCDQKPLPFKVSRSSLLFSLGQFRQWQNNFAIVHKFLGDDPLGNMGANDPAALSILPKLQGASNEMHEIDLLLDALEVATPLYKSFARKPRSRKLFTDGDLTDAGKALLSQVCEAVKIYDDIPELRSYDSDRASRRHGNLGPRGQRLRQWHVRKPLPIGGGAELQYVHDELKPLHLSGRHFRWSNRGKDLRLLSVDMLSKCAGKPVWCEVKMAGDSWTTAALGQVLLYGAMISGTNQQRRLEHQFPDKFDSTSPWLGIIVEERDDDAFSADHGKAIGFCRHTHVKDCLKRFFEGIHFLKIAASDANGNAWTVTHAETIPWREE
jgi:hypothetical protein